MTGIKEVLAQFKKKHILVIGDIMMDHYIKGTVERISPEAPVPVVNVQQFDDRLGGAGNVACNIVAYGAKASLLTIIGKDDAGKKIVSILKKNKISTNAVIKSTNRITTVKARVIGNNHQLLRFDVEQTNAITTEEELQVFNKLKDLISTTNIDAVILEDYNKGLLTNSLIRSIIAYCNLQSIPTLVDPKKHNFFAYKNATLFKPNLKETKESLEYGILPVSKDLVKATLMLRKKMKHKLTFITLAEKGIFYFESLKKNKIVPTSARAVSDVSGAGDTVIATMALSLVSGLSLDQIANLSNIAGGIVCEKPGVVTIHLPQLIHECEAI
jgi:rfaE bifunctional protein kinase chain/domain